MIWNMNLSYANGGRRHARGDTEEPGFATQHERLHIDDTNPKTSA